MPTPALAAPADRSLFRGYRFPPEVIAHAVWLYFRFHLSLRDVQDLLAERGLVVSHESIRQWCDTFGPTFAAGLRKRRARPGDKWHCDEMLLKINGKRYWLWRAVDRDGIVLDILVQERRDQVAAEVFLRRVLASCDGAAPRVIVTDKLASYVPAIKRVLPTAEHRRHKGLNNRAENSHLPVRKRERTLQRFKSKGHAQRSCQLERRPWMFWQATAVEVLCSGPISRAHVAQGHLSPEKGSLPADLPVVACREPMSSRTEAIADGAERSQEALRGACQGRTHVLLALTF